MTRRGVSQKALAERAQTTEATISRYLSGARSPENFTILKNVALILNVSSDYLLGVTDNPFEKGTLPAEVKDLLTFYLRAGDADKKILWAILDKYRGE